jgi:hypothetical protein
MTGSAEKEKNDVSETMNGTTCAARRGFEEIAKLSNL